MKLYSEVHFNVVDFEEVLFNQRMHETKKKNIKNEKIRRNK